MNPFRGIDYVLTASLALAAGLAIPAAGRSLDTLRDMSDGVADIVEQVTPSVVVVQTESTVVPVFNTLWGRRAGTPQKTAGQGSGVLIDKQGHILTSQHVIDDAQLLTVVVSDGTTFEATLVGEDPHTDLAVIKIKDLDGYTVTPIEQGDSDVLRVGEFVIAVGSPFSLSSSVTLGIVSQKQRTVGMLPYEDFIQTDAAINPGNSGGPLMDLHGRMVGINAIIQTGGSRGSVGIGFSVPGNRAFAIAKTLIAGEAIERPWLGIFPGEITMRAAMYYFDQEGAVYADQVFRDTPAHKGGMRPGDVILKINDEPVLSIVDLQRMVFKGKIGDPITVTVWRKNRTQELEITTEVMPHPEKFQDPNPEVH